MKHELDSYIIKVSQNNSLYYTLINNPQQTLQNAVAAICQYIKEKNKRNSGYQLNIVIDIDKVIEFAKQLRQQFLTKQYLPSKQHHSI